MASSNVNVETIIGFVTDVTGEKRGPAKHYRRFNLITSSNEILFGWIFAETSLEETNAGKLLLTAQQNNTALRVHGKISNGKAGGRSIKVSISNKFDKSIEQAEVNTTMPDQVSTICLLTDAITSASPCCIQVFILDKHTEVEYTQDEKKKKYCTLIVGDTSGTAVLVVYDEIIQQLKLKETWIITQVKSKKIHQNTILTTSPTSTCVISKEKIEPNLDNLNNTLAVNLLDEEMIVMNIDEIADLKNGLLCSTCRESMTPVEGKEHLLHCNNCSRYALAKGSALEATITLMIEGQKMIFWTAKGVLGNFLQEQTTATNRSTQDLPEDLLSNGPWHITVSHFRRQILKICKE